MSLKCSCGCGRDLEPEDHGLNKWGELETMRSSCRKKGRGEGVDISEMEGEFWNYLEPHEVERYITLELEDEGDKEEDNANNNL